MKSILKQRLEEAKKQNLYRSLKHSSGIDLTSNDYLGFAEEQRLRDSFLETVCNTPLGAKSSRLLRGNMELFEETEDVLAKFVQRESAVLFPTGYQANLALLSALLKPEDIAFSDRLNHASIIDGLQLAKAQKIIYPHRNYQFLETQLKLYKSSRNLKVIISESLFSMDGTLADLHELVRLANQYEALLIIDEAHSTGIWGTSLVHTLGLNEQVFATIHTGGKALGAAGAWVAGDSVLKDLLVNFARPFIFSTAPLPFLAHLLQAAVALYYQVGAERSAAILARSKKFQQLLKLTNKDITPIVPIIIGSNSAAEQTSQALQQLGWNILPIRPPSVPIGTARLRITVKWANTEDQLQQFVQDLHTIKEKHPA